MHPSITPDMFIRNSYKGCLRLGSMSENRCFAIFLGQKSRLFNRPNPEEVRKRASGSPSAASSGSPIISDALNLLKNTRRNLTIIATPLRAHALSRTHAFDP